MMDRRSFLIGGAGILGAAVSGCGGEEEKNGGGPPAPGGRVRELFAIIPKMKNNPVFTLAQRGAERAAKQIEGVDVKVEYNGSQTGIPAEQADVIRQMISKRVHGMSISVIDANAVREIINEAVDQEIQVICFDSDCPNSKRRTFTAVDNKKLGRELVAQMVRSVGSPEQMDGSVAILSGQASAPNLQDRVSAAREELARLPRVRVLETLFCDDKPEQAIEQMRVTMAANPDLRGWVMVGGWALFRSGALDSVRDFQRTRVVSVDALPEQIGYIERGQVACLLAQRCFGWGEDSVNILHRLRTDPDYKPPEFIDAGYDVVLREPTAEQRKVEAGSSVKVYSAAEYRTQWEEWNRNA